MTRVRKHSDRSKLVSAVRSAGWTNRRLAAAIGGNITLWDVANFIHRNYTKIARGKKKAIRQFFLANGLIKPQSPRPKHHCPFCGSLHTIKKHHVQKTSARLSEESQENRGGESDQQHERRAASISSSVPDAERAAFCRYVRSVLARISFHPDSRLSTIDCSHNHQSTIPKVHS